MEATAKVYTLKPDIAKLANEFITRNKVSITDFALKINYDRSTVSKFLKGKYDSDSAAIENAIIRYFEEIGEPVTGKSSGDKSVQAAPRPSFYPTNDASLIIGVCQSCQEFTSLGIIIGRTGHGKSYTLAHYSKMPRVCYIECDESMTGARDLVEAIEKGLGLPTMSSTIWKRVAAIKEFFNVNKGYLLIVDEADKLLNKYTQKKMEILRSIFDQSDVGLVIAGEPMLEILIKKHLHRFANRVDFYTCLKGLSRKEVEKFLEGYHFNELALEEMVHRATNSKTGCFRLLDRTLKNVLRIVNPDAEITLDDIIKASAMMML